MAAEENVEVLLSRLLCGEAARKRPKNGWLFVYVISGK